MVSAVAFFQGEHTVGVREGRKDVDERDVTEGALFGEDGIEFAGIQSSVLVGAGDLSAFGLPDADSGYGWRDTEDSDFSWSWEGPGAFGIGGCPFAEHSGEVSVFASSEVDVGPEADVDFAAAEDQDIARGEIEIMDCFWQEGILHMSDALHGKGRDRVRDKACETFEGSFAMAVADCMDHGFTRTESNSDRFPGSYDLRGP